MAMKHLEYIFDAVHQYIVDTLRFTYIGLYILAYNGLFVPLSHAWYPYLEQETFT